MINSGREWDWMDKEKKMAEKDVIYALELLHTVQIKKECLEFASFVDEKFTSLSKETKEKLWQEYLKQPKMSKDVSYTVNNKVVSMPDLTGKIIDLIKEYPNDADLGKKVRQLILNYG